MTDPLDIEQYLRHGEGCVAAPFVRPVYEACTCGLTEATSALRVAQVPDGHTRIDGKLFRLERHGDLNRYGLVRVEANDD